MDSLFNRITWEQAKQQLVNNLKRDIDSITIERFNTESIEEIAEPMFNEHRLNPPLLSESEIYQNEPKETDDKSATVYTINVPFKGDANLLYVQPSQYTLTNPSGKINNHTISVQYKVYSHQNANGIKDDFDRNLRSIKFYLEKLEADCHAYNSLLKAVISNHLQMRKDKLNNDTKRANDLNFPIK